MFPAIIFLLHAPFSGPRDYCGQNTVLHPGGTGDFGALQNNTPPFYTPEQIKENTYENN